MTIDYSGFYWEDIKKYGSSVLLLDIDQPGMIKELPNDTDLREILAVDKYIEHRSTNHGPRGFVQIYDIIEKSIDNRGNLLLFVKCNLTEFNK
ncbi:hypothetical protein FZD47_02385 [Bacillus infantis]|uniref:Uncharacterized protein n=1 Tax=Bacillus infantis TaxID=324767 RepID=A0A5D4SWH5_9BACI|nr:hypothetical protein [Bacillus infantis]TYS66354.1 hypothetical protein FZD47_02385 [Bacillus infantis]